ncbi:hypothetical protein A2U01_0063212, partial [Trifolium medium]|nr:hypothetical protein [Trifolium medium]
SLSKYSSDRMNKILATRLAQRAYPAMGALLTG